MKDHIPPIDQQGFDVTLFGNVDRCYNSGCFVSDEGELMLVSRRANIEEDRNDIVVNRVVGKRTELVRELDLPSQTGKEHLEDPRVIDHIDKHKRHRRFIAYTEGRYATQPWVSVQKLVEVDEEFNVISDLHMPFRGNGKTSEKNWQFFSSGGKMFFVYSISPHVVVEIDPDDGSVIAEYDDGGDIQWPFGTLSGGTPPVRTKQGFVSFFHSYVPHAGRNRRYSMGAYLFSHKAPFELLGITEPLLVGSGNTPFIENTFTTWWAPLVIFPCGAVYKKGQWDLSAGVNDSYEAMIRIPHNSLDFRKPEEFAEKRPYYFQTTNAATPVRLTKQRIMRWTPVGEAVAGVRAGVVETTDPEVICALLGRVNVTQITESEFRNHG